MRTRALKQWTDSNGKSHTDLVWFGSYGLNQDGTKKVYDELDSDNSFSKDQQSVVDGLTQRLSVLRNELWYRVTYGVQLFDKVSTKAVVDSYIMSVISDYPDAYSIEEFSSKVSNRAYTCNVKILSKFGEILLSI